MVYRTGKKMKMDMSALKVTLISIQYSSLEGAEEARLDVCSSFGCAMPYILV